MEGTCQSSNKKNRPIHMSYEISYLNGFNVDNGYLVPNQLKI